MQAQPLCFGELLFSTQGVESQISELEAQMQGMQPNSAEYQYDQLQLEREQMELQIRQENPNLDPQSLDGSAALQKILDNDPRYQLVNEQLQQMLKAYGSEASSWGIPMGDPADAKFIVLS